MFKIGYCFVLFRIFANIKISSGSVAGLTYRDEFDFQTRHRDHYKCDPLYWHPLPLPEDCIEMYEKLIRSRIASLYPVHLVEPMPRIIPSSFKASPVKRHKLYKGLKSRKQLKRHRMYHANIDKEERRIRKKSKKHTMFNKLMGAISPDGNGLQGKPIMSFSNLGPVLIYKEPVSKKGAEAIKGIAISKTKNKSDEKRKVSFKRRPKRRRRHKKRKRNPINS